MKLSYKSIILATLWFWVSISATHANDNDTRVSKIINEEFVMSKNGHLEIINKYGQVLVNNSDSDSVIVKIEVIAYGKDRSAANKIIDRADFDFSQTNGYLTLETVLDRKSGAFKEMWNNIGDYSKTLLSKNKLEINYEVYVPKSISVSINNKFGDVFISERDKKVDIDLSHGNLRADNFNAVSNISVSYGKAEIKDLKDGKLNFKSSEVTIETVGSIDIRSSSSEIVVRKADEVLLNSRSDKLIEINTVSRLKGEMTFSKLNIENLSKNLDIELNYSDVDVAHILFNFSLIRIEGKSSDIDLEFEANTYMDVDIKAFEHKLQLPTTGFDKEYIDEKKGLARFKGIVGVKNNYQGSLNIDSQRGAINIKLKTQPQSVKSK